MLNQILQDTRKPQGFWGEVMLFGINNGHKRLSDWPCPICRCRRAPMCWMWAAGAARILPSC